jgi:hypothetical protein
VVEGSPEGRHGEVVEREAGRRLGGEAVVLHGPVGRTLTLEPLVVEVLMEVQQGVDALGRQQLGSLADALDVGVVVLPGRRLDRLPDQAQPYGREAVLGQEGRVVGAEPVVGGLVRAGLAHHVHAVRHEHAAVGVQEPATGLAGPGRVRGLGRRGDEERRGGDGCGEDDAADGSGSDHGGRLSAREPREGGFA